MTHGIPLNEILLSLAGVLVGAKVAGHIAVKCKQPAVLGELIFGVLLGNLALVGLPRFDFLLTDPTLKIFSELGVILLLFLVGLETNVHEMRRVGASSFLVATLGVVAPFFLGWGVSSYFQPEAELLVHIFVGATLCATSVGITARVLKDLNKIRTPEAAIILGAAVIDDVLGLVILATVTGAVQAAEAGGSLDLWQIGRIIGVAFAFLAAAVAIGGPVAKRIFTLSSRLESPGVLVAVSLAICFGMSYLAALAGLAPIVGAFTAGLILDRSHYAVFCTQSEKDAETKEQTIEHLIEPIAQLFLPVFFVLTGAHVDLAVFRDPAVLGYAAALSLAAVIGKQICSLGVLQKGLDRMIVGIGMIPRGEVGLIFIGVGAGLTLHGHKLIDPVAFGALVIVVIITTLITPPLLTWRYARR